MVLQRTLLATSSFLFAVLVACGEPPPPPPVSEVFDDPLAEAESAAAENAAPAPAPTAAAVAAGEGATGGEVVAAAASGAEVVATGAEAVAVAPAGAEASAAPAGGEAGQAAVAGDAGGGAEASAATKTSRRKARPEEAPPSGGVAPKASEPAPAPVAEPAKTEPAKVEPAKTEPEPPPAPPQLRYAGTYSFSGGEKQRGEVEAAIEAAAQQMNALIRGIGRKRLTESNPIREKIVIAVDGEEVSVTFAAGRTVAGRLGGPAVDWTSDSGKPVKVGFSMVKGRLVLQFTAEDGQRRSVFSLDESGSKMTMSVTITSDRLETPMKYALSYRRG